jgi:hypothetical protein
MAKKKLINNGKTVEVIKHDADKTEFYQHDSKR